MFRQSIASGTASKSVAVILVSAALSGWLLISSCDLTSTEYVEVEVEVTREVFVESRRTVEVEVTRVVPVEVTRIKEVVLPFGFESPTPAPTYTPTPTPSATHTATPTVTPTPTPEPITEISFVPIATTKDSPSKVQVVFSLRNQGDHAIVRDAEEIQRVTKVYEEGPGTDGFEEIDYSETSFFVHTAENFELEVVFVLDFTNSMAEATLPDGRSGIDAMIEAFKSSLDVLASSHRVGVVEFHDRNVDPRVLSPLTTNRPFVQTRVAAFNQSDFDPGSSRVWDGLTTAIGLFSTRETNPRGVRALVFLSDGRDTSSVNSREFVLNLAQHGGVQLYVMGVGEVFQEARLRDMSRLTNGNYYPAREPALVQKQLEIIVNDLRGQYQVSYITLRREGIYRTKISAELDGILGETTIGSFDVGSFFGPDNIGNFQFDPPSIDTVNNRTTTFLRALHVPRNIDHIRFKIGSDLQANFELVGREDGGLLEDWDLSGPGEDGFYDLRGHEPIEFGNFGLLFRLTISNVDAAQSEIPFEFDNSIYSSGKKLQILSSEGVVGQPAHSGRILFTSDRGGDRDLYIMDLDGSDVLQLTDDGSDDVTPHWSPDRQQVLFASDRDGDYDLYVMNLDGTGLVQITATQENEFYPRWSPNGEQIVFVSDLDGNQEIQVIDSDGSNGMFLTDHPDGDTFPQWSPDGLQVLFASDRGGDLDLYVINSDGSGLTQLTNHPDRDSFPQWSPDASQIAFASNRDGNLEIYTMSSDGTAIARLTEHENSDFLPYWSPDGQQLAFSSNRDGHHDIYMIDSNGDNLRRITDYPGDEIAYDWTGQ